MYGYVYLPICLIKIHDICINIYKFKVYKKSSLQMRTMLQVWHRRTERAWEDGHCQELDMRGGH